MPRKTFRKIIVTKEILGKINSETEKLINSFLKEKSTRSSNKTISSYRCDLNIFSAWNFLYNDNKFFVDIRKLEFANFFSFTTNEMKWGSARNNRVRSTLSSFSIFIEKFFDSEYPAFKNIVLKTIESVPKNERREKTILNKGKRNFKTRKSKTHYKSFLSLTLIQLPGNLLSKDKIGTYPHDIRSCRKREVLFQVDDSFVKHRGFQQAAAHAVNRNPQ